VVEQDHGLVKHRMNPSWGCGALHTAPRTIRGDEAMYMLRKGQLEGLAKGDILAPNRMINEQCKLAASRALSQPPLIRQSVLATRPPSRMGQLLAGAYAPTVDDSPKWILLARSFSRWVVQRHTRIFNGPPTMNRASFRLRQQYQNGGRASSAVLGRITAKVFQARSALSLSSPHRQPSPAG
jgi:hypothetical protein